MKYLRIISLCTALLFFPSFPYARAEALSSVQIRTEGSSASQDGITISKTISGTEKENVFDIRLSVSTWHSLEQLRQAEDAAVVIVMDLSATMNQIIAVGGSESRLDGAKHAASTFIRAFCDSNRLLGTDRELGLVTFHQDAQTVLPLTKPTQTSAAQWQKQVNALAAPASGQHGKGWTNIEAGLQLAKNLLDKSSAAHKYVILITDGFPTTFIADGDRTGTGFIAGRNPYSGLMDEIKGVECTMGTSYSETGARKARAAAEAIKQGGADIFSIGVGLGGPIEVPSGSGKWVAETIQAHIDRITWNASVVERPSDVAQKGYEIGIASDSDSYRRWLGGHSGGIGGGPNFTSGSALWGTHGAYVDASDTAAMTRAFETILQEIERINENAIRDTWIAADPMSSSVTFLNFLNADGHAAAFSQSTLQWDLKSSPFTTRKEGNTTWYSYSLSYRVRLKNEAEGFLPATPAEDPSEPACFTNGSAALYYKVEQNGRLTDERSLHFPHPEVEGYLGRLAFAKYTTETGGGHAGVRFVLRHTGADCPECEGTVNVKDFIAVSGADGSVSISGIPSGHTYTLDETNTSGYHPQPHTVTVRYGTTVLYDQNRQIVTSITNRLLPDTLTLTAEKRMNGLPPGEDGVFSFVLADPSGRPVEISSADADGHISFQPLVFNVPGTYAYRMYELPGKNPTILYDPSVYTIIIEAVKTDDGCKASVVRTERSGQPADMILFENRTRHLPPSTGDRSQPLLWMGLLLPSGLSLCFLCKRSSSRK